MSNSDKGYVIICYIGPDNKAYITGNRLGPSAWEVSPNDEEAKVFESFAGAKITADEIQKDNPEHKFYVESFRWAL